MVATTYRHSGEGFTAGTAVRVLRDEGRKRQGVSRSSKLLHLSGYMGDAMVNTVYARCDSTKGAGGPGPEGLNPS